MSAEITASLRPVYNALVSKRNAVAKAQEQFDTLQESLAGRSLELEAQEEAFAAILDGVDLDEADFQQA